MFDRFSGLIQQKPIWWGARLDELVRNTKILNNTCNFIRWIRSWNRTYCIDDVLYIHMLMRGQDSQEHFFEVTSKEIQRGKDFFSLSYLNKCCCLAEPWSSRSQPPGLLQLRPCFRKIRFKISADANMLQVWPNSWKSLIGSEQGDFVIWENTILRCYKSKTKYTLYTVHTLIWSGGSFLFFNF